jgi:hypothetical protein
LITAYTYPENLEFRLRDFSRKTAEFAIREKGIIIFDSLTDWLEGESENDPSKMTEVSRKFRRLARLGSGVIVLHHDNKNGVGYRGSTAIPAGSDMAIKMAKNELTGIVEIRTERFRMCESWEMDIKFSFGKQYTVQVLKDKAARDSYKKESDTEMATVAKILRTHHEENNGAGMNQIQVINALQASGISKTKARNVLLAGVDKKRWVFKSGDRNAIVYNLVGWGAGDAASFDGQEPPPKVGGLCPRKLTTSESTT